MGRTLAFYTRKSDQNNHPLPIASLLPILYQRRNHPSSFSKRVDVKTRGRYYLCLLLKWVIGLGIEIGLQWEKWSCSLSQIWGVTLCNFAKN
jgi:hypothetical protein